MSSRRPTYGSCSLHVKRSGDTKEQYFSTAIFSFHCFPSAFHKDLYFTSLHLSSHPCPKTNQPSAWRCSLQKYFQAKKRSRGKDLFRSGDCLGCPFQHIHLLLKFLESEKWIKCWEIISLDLITISFAFDYTIWSNYISTFGFLRLFPWDIIKFGIHDLQMD